MSLLGKLEDVHLRDLLSLIAGRRMSGRLSLRTEGDGGAILFREGSIVGAASSRDPQSLGSLLVAERHIAPRDLHEAIELQKHGLVKGRLARVLERKGAVSASVLEDVVRRKVRRVIEGLLEWNGGFFHFEPARVADHGEVVIDPGEFVDLAHAIPYGSSDELADVSGELPALPELEAAPGEGEELLGLEFPGPSVSGEATVEILAAAREEVARGVLFVVRHDAFCEMATVGVERVGPDPAGGEELRIPRQAASILHDAAESGAVVHGVLEESEWNRALVERLGGGWPPEALALPAAAAGRTVLVFYGDRSADEPPVGDATRLQRVMADVSAGMERDVAERRQRQSRAPWAQDLMDSLEERPEAESLATVSRKVDRLIAQNESLLREYRLREQSFWHLAHHDPLTSLPNRFLFRELLGKEVAHARQEGDLLAVAMFNIDHFKDVNDHFGEALGDELLAEVATRISGIVRAEDTLARLSGDGFALVIPKCHQADNAMLVVRRVFDAFAEPFRVQQNEILLSLSMGVSFYPEDGRAPSELIVNAEAALRSAKETGRNNFRVFAPTMNEWAQVRMELAQDLRRAITRNEGLSLLFQPIIALDSGHVVGAEALLRWKPPEQPTIEARTLVELAEDTGQMPALGEWVLREACSWSARWQGEVRAVPLWVNVSIRQFQAGGLVEAVMRALHETNLPPELLRIEITESIAALNVPNVRESLDRLDKLGVAVVLDDFGSGYSSLSFLMRFSVTGLKIGGAFVSDVPSREEACAVVEASIGIGKHLGLDVVAEGVESEEQLRFLRERGCPFAQGYYLSGPITPDALEGLLREDRVLTPGSEPQPGTDLET